MRDHLRSLELETKSRKENSDLIVDRLRDLATTTFKLHDQQHLWEKTLATAITTSATEHINFLRAVQGQRLVFMPHSPGVYIALVLKQLADIDADQQASSSSPLKAKDMN